LRLLAEPRQEFRVAAVLRAEELDGDVAVELVVVAAVDRGHAALSEQLDQPVAAAQNRPDFRHAGPPCGLPCTGSAAGRRRAGIVPRADRFAGPGRGWCGRAP